MCEGMSEQKRAYWLSIFLEPTSASETRIEFCNTHKPVAATNDTRAPVSSVTEYEHVQLAFLNHHEDVHPRSRLGFLAGHLPELFATKHTLFRPWGTKQRQFLVRNADGRRSSFMTVHTMIIILLGFTNDRMRQVGSESQGRRQERSTGPSNLILVFMSCK
jgi:hypothetical protein